jgi:choline kinase/SAM-dependent methyltransferase
MKAIILAAGKPTFTDTPVSNIVICGERLLDMQISVLHSAGVDDIVVVTGYKHHEISRADVTFFRNEYWEQAGSITSLQTVNRMFDGSDDVIVLYGDTLFEPWIVESLQRAEAGISAVCFLDRQNRDVGKFREYAEVGDGGMTRISSCVNSHGLRTVFTGLVHVKRHKTEIVRRYIEELGEAENTHVGGMLNLMLRKGVSVNPVIIEHGWVELTSTSMYEEALAEAIFLERVIQIHTDWNDRAKGYSKLDWVNNDNLLSTVVDVGVEGRPRKVLDLGTGTGKVLLALRDTLRDGEFWGVDISEAMVAKIPDRTGLKIKICGAEDLDGVPVDHFDLVTARMVFHHINNSGAAMRNIRGVLRPGGRLVICEGVPPSTRSVHWYTDMFRYKEDRKTLTEGDIIQMYAKAGFEDIRARSVVMKRASLNNWLDNSGIPERNIEHIKQLHFSAPPEVVEDYEMEFTGGDCFMTWRFVVVVGRKPA